ncbi:MAG: FAD binding domain-containing protein [Anaerolineales bacterium]|nr:FAD binding domain-containing protein [Anaerolineales bacterium]
MKLDITRLWRKLYAKIIKIMIGGRRRQFLRRRRALSRRKVPPSSWCESISCKSFYLLSTKSIIGRRSMPHWKHYHKALSINDALKALFNAPGSARLLAGGTDLLLDLQQGRHSPVDTLVDISSIPELLMIEERSGMLFIGAAVTMSRIVSSSLVCVHAQALTDACALIGGPQVRNSATLGGNVAHALPAADGTIALLALGAEAEVADQNDSRTVPMQKLFLGPGHSSLHPERELLVGFYLPLRKKRMASSFKRIMRPQGVALPILNLAVWIHRKNDPSLESKIADIRIAVGPGGPVPTRAIETEKFLRRKTMTEKVIASAMEILVKDVHLRTSPYRATSIYRQRLAKVLFRDVIHSAWIQTL